jgi:hypothetical protein
MQLEKPFISLPKLVVLVLGCVILALNSCQRDSESHHKLATAAPQKLVAAERKPLPHCPDAPYRMLQANDPGTGHHRVFLRWSANTSAGEKDSSDLGYCLYRTQTAGRAKDCPKKYPQCEQVNVMPVRGTRCLDDLVKDNTTYYYVVIAISSSGTSTTSEEAIAEVPAAGKRNPPPPDADSYPACRVTVASNQPTGR